MNAPIISYIKDEHRVDWYWILFNHEFNQLNHLASEKNQQVENLVFSIFYSYLGMISSWKHQAPLLFAVVDNQNIFIKYC